MNWLNLLNQLGSLKLVQGVEKDLRIRKFRSRLSLYIGILSALVQILIVSIQSLDDESTASLFEWFVKYYSDWKGNPFSVEYIWFYLAIATFFIYFLLTHTKFLLKEAKEPFHFTFWIHPFEYITSKEGGGFVDEEHNQLGNQLNLDLTARLVDRIKRLSLLKVEALDNENTKGKVNPSSHIDISGHFYFSEKEEEYGETDQGILVQILPRVRIGNELEPENLTYPVKYELPLEEETTNTKRLGIAPEDYKKILERVYSSISTEIYRQIRSDLESKMKLLPTRYMKAIAYYVEAEDFARSNTIDSYDLAIDLYQKSIFYFQKTYHNIWAKISRNVPTIWARFQLDQTLAKAVIGYSRCLIYRRQVSAFSGRNKNPLFAIPSQLNQVLEKLVPINRKVSTHEWRMGKMEGLDTKLSRELAYFQEEDFFDLNVFSQRITLATQALYTKKTAPTPENGMGSYTYFDSELCKKIPHKIRQKLLAKDIDEAKRNQLVLQGINELLNKNLFRLIRKSDALPYIRKDRELHDYLENRKNPNWKLFEKVNPHNRKWLMFVNRLTLEYLYPDQIKSFKNRTENQIRTDSTMDYLTLNHQKRHALESNSENHKRILFDAYVTMALTYAYLDAPLKAQHYLRTAKSIAPALSERDACYLLSAGELEPDIRQKMPFFERSIEQDPAFEIAHYLLANTKEMVFRDMDEITSERVKSVIDQYDEVLKLNPGNIASLVSQGNLFWLVKEPEKARKKYIQGIEMKAIVQQTFIGELLYGMAKVNAELGHINAAFDNYTRAISADPGVATYSTIYSSRKSTANYYDYIGPSMLKRFKDYTQNVGKILLGENILREDDIPNLNNFINNLKDFRNEAANLIYRYLGMDLQQLIEYYPKLKETKPLLKRKLIAKLNEFITTDNYPQLFKKLESLLHEGDQEEVRKCGRVFNKEVMRRFMLERSLLGQLRVKKKSEIIYSTVKSSKLPTRVRDTVFAMALNEFGNASLHFYLRFGYKESSHLSNAIESYEQASALVNDENKVILYNQLYAYSYSHEKVDFNKQYKLLNKTLNASATWHSGNITLVKLGLTLFKKREKELRININREKEKKEKAEAELKGLQDNIQGSMEELSQRVLLPETGDQEERNRLENTGKGADIPVLGQKVTTKERETSWQSSGFTQSSTIPKRSELQKNIRDTEINISRYKHDLDQLPELKNEFINREVNEIMAKTKLYSLYEGLSFKESIEQINELIKKIEKERLDDNDLEALSLWVEALSEREEIIYDTQEMTKWLCNWLINEYSFDKYNLIKIMRKIELKQMMHKLKELKMQTNDTSISSQIPLNPDIQIDMIQARHLDCELVNIQNYYLQRFPNYFWYEKDFFYQIEFDLGDMLFQLEAYEDADTFFQLALKEIPHSNSYSLAIIYAEKGFLAVEQKKMDQAISYYQRALQYEPHSSDYYFQLGNAYYLYAYQSDQSLAKDAMRDKACEYYLKAIEIEWTSSEYYYSLGQIYQETKDYGLAEVLMNLAVQQSNYSEDSYLNQLGNVYYRNQRYEKALDCYIQAQQIRPEVSFYLSNQGLVYEKLNHLDLAENALTAARKMEDQDDPLILNDLGNIEFKKKNYQKAVEYYKLALGTTRDSSSENTPTYFVNYLGALSMQNEQEKDEQAEDKEGIERIEKEAFLNQLKNNIPELNNHGPSEAPQKAKIAELVNQYGNLFYENQNYKKANWCYELTLSYDTEKAIYWSNKCLAESAISNLEQAENAIQQAIKLDASNAHYYDLLGTVYIKGKNFSKAKEAYIKAMDLEPEAPDYRVKLVAIYDLLAQTSAANRVIKNAQAVKPDDDNYQNRLGNAYYHIKYYGQARESYQKAIQINDTNPTYHYNLGLVHKEENKEAEAERSILNAIKLKPYHGLYYNELGNILFKLKKYEGAIKYYEQAIQIEDKRAVYFSNVALMYKSLAEDKKAKLKEDATLGELKYENELKTLFEKSLNNYEKACQMEPYNASYFDQASVLCNDFENFEQAAYYSQKALDLEPTNVLYYQELGFAYQQMGYWIKSAETYEKAAQLNSALKKDNYFNKAGLVWYYGEKYAKAIENYQKALEINKENAIYHENIALAYKEMGQNENAIQELEYAQELKPTFISSIYHKLGTIYDEENKYDKAVDNYRKAIENAAKDNNELASYQKDLGLFYTRLGMLRQAEIIWRNVLETDKEKGSWVLIHLGKNYLWQNDLEKAEITLKKAHELASNSHEVNFYYGWLQSKSGSHLNAALNLTIAITLNYESAEYYTRLAVNYLYLEKLNNTEEFLKTAIKIDPDYGLAHLYYAKIMNILEKPEEADQAYQKAMQAKLNSTYEYAEFILELVQQGKEEMADQFLEKTLHEKNDPWFLLNLGIQLEKERPQASARAIQKALELPTDCILFFQKVGDYYYDKKSYEKAIPLYYKLLDKAPEDMNTLLFLIKSLEEIGNLEEADIVFENRLKQMGDNAKKLNSLGNSFFKQGQNDRAYICYRKAIEKEPNEVVYYGNLIISLYRGNKLEEAKIFINEVLKDHQHELDFLEKLAEECLHHKLNEFALFIYQQLFLMKIEAKYVIRIYALYMETGQLEQAKTFIQALFDKNDLPELFWDQLGLDFGKSNYFQEAVFAFSKALAISTDPHKYYPDLAYLYAQLGNYEQSANIYLELLQLRPGEKTAKEGFMNVINLVQDPEKRNILLEKFQEMEAIKNE